MNRIYESKIGGIQIMICGKKKDKYLCKVLTNKPGVYAGTHTMSNYTLKARYRLVE